MSARLRVAIVSFDFGEVCVRMANALAPEADVTLLLPRRHLDLANVAAGPGVDVVPFAKPRLRQPLHQAAMCARVVRAIRRAGPDVVHLQQGHLWFNLVLRALPRPLVVTVHDASAHPGDRGGQRTPQVAMDLAFRRADRLIVHAHSVKDELLRRLPRDPSEVHVIPHVAIGMTGTPLVEEDAHTVLFFGRIWPYKGLEHLIAAAPAIAERVPAVRFVVAGQGEDLDRYRAMMAEPSRFEVIDEFVSLERRAELFARAAVVVLPYVEASQSGVVPVASAFSKPAVVTSVGGLPEAVDDGRTGLIVPPRDPARLAEAVVSLLEDPARRHAMGAAARRKLEEEWSPETVAAQTLRVYEAATAARHPAATALHRLLVARHWRGDGLAGPDCGIRLNYRAGRFVKSALRALPWRDDLYYLQAQGYWMLALWRLYDVTGDPAHPAMARATARGVIGRQRPDGAWDYPNPEWRGRVTSVEGTWAAIGLLETYRRTGDTDTLAAALRWHDHLEEEVGYQPAGGGLAANYWSRRPGNAVPNIAAMTLRLLAELTDVTGDDLYLNRAPQLVRFLAAVQLESGELPYAVAPGGRRARLHHFQCAQYNAFECLDLVDYLRLTGDPDVRSVIAGQLRFLRSLVRDDGAIPYACGERHPEVSYHLAAVAAALHEGAKLGEAGCADPAARALRRLSSLQRRDGGFDHSRRDYRVLADRRTYPRHLAMLLHHLLGLAPTGERTRRAPRSRARSSGANAPKATSPMA